MNNFYIYEHYSRETGELRYIGKGNCRRAWDLRKRNKYWNNCFPNKNPVVVIVANGLEEKQALNLEIKMIKLAKEAGFKLCNLTDGGEGVSGHYPSEETRKKQSIAKIGKHLSVETRKKLSENALKQWDKQGRGGLRGNEYYKQWAAKNKEKLKEYRKRYRNKKKEIV